MADVTVENLGTIFMFYPQTDAAWDWVEENIKGPMQRFGPELAVEHRYAADLAAGMKADGLEVE